MNRIGPDHIRWWAERAAKGIEDDAWKADWARLIKGVPPEVSIAAQNCPRRSEVGVEPNQVAHGLISETRRKESAIWVIGKGISHSARRTHALIAGADEHSGGDQFIRQGTELKPQIVLQRIR
jgi:hypothetical protein